MDSSAAWSRGRLEPVACCPACGSGRRDHHTLARHDNEGAMPDVWHMARCLDCGSLWLDPRPDAESLPRAYDVYYTHDAESEDVPDHGAGGLAWRLIRGYLDRRFGLRRGPANALGCLIFSVVEPWRLKLDYYGRHLTHSRFKKPGRLLDVGCGNGAFLARATDMGWRAQGCEIDPKAVITCRGIHMDVIEGDAFHPSLDGEIFDVITMSHVIEHVADQRALLRRVHALLRPGGMFWMALPNPESEGSRVFGAAWHALHPPYHVCIPSQSVLENWMKDAGFADVRFLRRGAHVRRLWRISQAIARRDDVPTPSASALLVHRLKADLLATLSPRRAEETVILARKPDMSDVR